MAVGAFQLVNTWGDAILQDADTQWDATGITNFAWLLLKSTAAPVDTDSTVVDWGTPGTDWIDTGDGSPIDVITRSITFAAGDQEFKAGDAVFGPSVTITARHIGLVRADAAIAIPSAALLIGTQLLDTTPADVSSTNSDFTVTAPASNIWWQVDVQA